jgi:hypothetical protein
VPRRPGRADRGGAELRQVPARPAGREAPAGQLGRRQGRQPGRHPGADAGLSDPADDRHLPAAGGRAGAPVRDPARPRRRPLARERRRDRRDEPVHRRDPRDGVVAHVQAERVHRPDDREEARPAARPESRPGAELPGPEPRHRGAVPAGVDVQAGDRARRDAAAADLALPDPPVHADVQGARPGLQELGPVREPADDAAGGAGGVLRHLLLPARLRVLRAAVQRQASTSARSRRACCRPRSGASPRTRRRPTRAAGRSTGSGSPATRSSSRSARRTCWSRRSRWCASTR